MKPSRIIIHTGNMDMSSHDFWRVNACIKEYYRIRPEAQPIRLTVRFTTAREICVYNKPEDAIICVEERVKLCEVK